MLVFCLSPSHRLCLTYHHTDDLDYLLSNLLTRSYGLVMLPLSPTVLVLHGGSNSATEQQPEPGSILGDVWTGLLRLQSAIMMDSLAVHK